MLTVVTGMQFGDEGKGRIVHNLALSSYYSAGVRAQGGNNAGHTVKHKGVLYKLNLLPTPALLGKDVYLGRAMVLDLDVLAEEIIQVRKECSPKIMIDLRAHVIMPWHKELDGINERENGSHAAGSTGRGIGPAYASKHERTGIRVCDFFDDLERVDALTDQYAQRVALRTGQLLYPNRYYDSISQIREKVSFLESYIGDVSTALHFAFTRDEHVLGECAQAEMLDVDGAYYPRGTSSGTSAAGFWNGIGVGPSSKNLGPVIGVAKAYLTRVGNGPFVTEITDTTLANTLREKGGEYGTTTGRARRVGWLDIPMLRHAVIPSGITHLALTKLDILGGMDEIPVVNHYRTSDAIPCLAYEKVKPYFVSMKGWPAFSEEEYKIQFESGVRNIPHTGLRHYLQNIEDNIGLPIGMISFGQESSAFISYI